MTAADEIAHVPDGLPAVIWTRSGQMWHALVTNWGDGWVITQEHGAIEDVVAWKVDR